MAVLRTWLRLPCQVLIISGCIKDLVRYWWQVYKATWKEVTMVAVKVIGGAASEELDSSEDQRDPEKAFESFCKEALIMCSLRDKNIVQFLGASLMVRPQHALP